MQTTQYLLLGIAILSWTEVLLAEPGWQDIVSAATNLGGGSSQPDPEPATTPGVQADAGIKVGGGSSQLIPKPAAIPDPSKIAEIVKDGLSLGENSKPDTGTSQNVDESSKPDTSMSPQPKPKPDPLAPSIVFQAPVNEIWVLSLNKTSVKLTPRSDTKGTHSGGPFGKNDKFVFKHIQLVWEMQPDGTYDAKVIGTYSNLKYSSKEALNHPVCEAEIHAPFSVNGTVDNPNFDIFQEHWGKIPESGGSTSIRSGNAISWFDSYHCSEGLYQWYRGSSYNDKTKKFDSCSTIIKLPMMKDANYISFQQFSSFIWKVKDSSGNPVDDNTQPMGKPSSKIEIGKGIQVSPV